MKVNDLKYYYQRSESLMKNLREKDLESARLNFEQ